VGESSNWQLAYPAAGLPVTPEACYNGPSVRRPHPGWSSPLIDLHCHILPGVDDGPASFEESLAMARLAEADGVQAIVTTPHCDLDTTCPDPNQIRDLTFELNDLLTDEGLRLRVLPGAEVRPTPGLLEALERDQVLTVADRGRFVLIELPSGGYPVFVAELFFRLQVAGITPIIAHAERSDYLRASPQVLEEMAARGYPIQVNVGSLLGADGAKVRREALRLVQGGLATVIASDGHGARSRKPVLTPAAKPLHLSRNAFLRFTFERPLDILRDRRVRQPEGPP
jgi:protein-tyrosine phosphatase